MRLIRSSRICVVVVALTSLTACNPAERAKEAKVDVENGNAAACREERAAIEKMVQSFMLLEPDLPVTEAAMFAAGYLRQQSVLMDVQPDGSVVPTPGTGCA